MTSSAPEVGDSSPGLSQRDESTGKQTVDTEDVSVSVGQYEFPGKAEDAQCDDDDIREDGTHAKPSLNDGAESKAAEQQSLHAGQQEPALHDFKTKASPGPALGNGWSSHPLEAGPDQESLAPDRMGLAAGGPVKDAHGAPAEPGAEAAAAAAESAEAPKRQRLSAKQVACGCQYNILFV